MRTYCEGRFSDETSDFFLTILTGWYKNLLHDIYVKNENVVFSSSKASKMRNALAKDFERHEENIKVFISRMQEKYQEEKY